MTAPDRTRTVTWQDPSIVVDAAKTRSGIERLRAVMDEEVPSAPMAILVGIKLTQVEPGRVVFEGTAAEYHYNLGGVAHGGLACTMLDSALGCAVTSMLPAGRSCATTDLHVRFIRPITLQSGALRCAATIIHVGKTIGTAEAKLTDSAGRLCAHATAACAILRETED
ncbi:MAG: PaaI family thioesterase [Candidatus Eremiobacteraeota bacterium]|nr:PaaI family thioesterase [Candidatus Eremiobacteraeota bacterium]